jgi:hypothetical protein
MQFLPSLAAIAALAAITAGSAAAADPPGGAAAPVVVELFTSQGCNSCPPADAFLGELAKRPGVIALGFHVDYWDYMGWKDPFAKPANTQRQKHYGRSLAQRYVFTPQMVVDGRFQDVGSDQPAIDQLIDRAARDREQGGAGRAPIKLDRQGDGLTVRIDGGALRGAGEETAAVWVAFYDRAHETDVAHGENGGRRLPNYNVVREFRRLGTYHGKPVALPLDLADVPPSCEAAAVLLQVNGTGPIVAAMSFDLPQR